MDKQDCTRIMEENRTSASGDESPQSTGSPRELRLTVAHEFLPKRRSTRSAIVMDHFGIDFEQGRHVIADNLRIPVAAGDVVLCTGESGSGKSSLLRALAQALQHQPGGEGTVIDVAAIPLGEALLIDRLPGSEAEAMHALSMCGLGDARLMLRTPCELSDGQRTRFQLALGVLTEAPWLLADEFTATLDRTLAKVVAYNVRRLADRTGRGFLLATTHEDIVPDVSPDVHVHCRRNGGIEVVRESSAAVEESKKNASENSHSSARRGSAAPPGPIGRISRGGITGATTWDRRDS